VLHDRLTPPCPQWRGLKLTFVNFLLRWAFVRLKTSSWRQAIRAHDIALADPHAFRNALMACLIVKFDRNCGQALSPFNQLKFAGRGASWNAAVHFQRSKHFVILGN